MDRLPWKTTLEKGHPLVRRQFGSRWQTQKSAFFRRTLATRANTLATRGEGHVEYHSMTAISAIECHGADRGFRVSGRCGNEEMVWEVERVIANVGYRADFSFARELHVVEPDGRSGIQQLEPNYFVLGAKSIPEGADFLLRNGYINIRDVFAKITRKPKLDLYQEKVVGQLKQAV